MSTCRLESWPPDQEVSVTTAAPLNPRPYAVGTSAVDWEHRYDFGRRRAGRVARAQEALEADRLDAVLVWKSENVRYLTSLRSQVIAGKDSILNAALLVPGHQPVLLCSGGEVDHAA